MENGKWKIKLLSYEGTVEIFHFPFSISICYLLQSSTAEPPAVEVFGG
jgi:hypothetical protein